MLKYLFGNPQETFATVIKASFVMGIIGLICISILAVILFGIPALIAILVIVSIASGTFFSDLNMVAKWIIVGMAISIGMKLLAA